MKNKFLPILLFFQLITMISLSVMAQAPDWNTHGTRADSSSLLGTSTYEDLRIVTDSTLRITVDRDGQTTFENKVIFNTSIKADSIQSDSNLVLNANLDLPNSWIHADSLKVRSIHVGDSSLIITTNTWAGAGNLISSNINQPIIFGRSNTTQPCGAGSPLTLSSFPGVTIGTGIGTYMLHIHNQYGACQNNPGSYAHFTVNATAIGGFNTGQNVNSGFLVGIGDDGVANLLQRENLAIHFLTNNSRRMTIQANGNIGMGDYSTFVPNYLLHLHNNTNNSDVWQQFTTLNTGITANDGFNIGLNYVPGGTPRTDVELIQHETADINFYTDFNNNPMSAMTIMGHNNIGGWGNNSGYVGIGNTEPLSMLHLGNMNCFNGNFCGAPNNATPAAGYRPWMMTGTFMCGVPGVTSSDHMYVGLMNVGGLDDRDDAVIAWGDNIGAGAGTVNGPDNLRFIFTEFCNEVGANATASSMNGLEGMRLMPYINPATNNFVSLNVGIGDFNFNNPVIPPMRRLEILDGMNTNAAPPTNMNLPQLRLTHTQNADVNLGIHADFQSIGVAGGGAGIGDLFINTINGVNSPNLYADYKAVRIDYPLIAGGATNYNSGDALDVNGQLLIKSVTHDDTQNRVLVWIPAPTAGATGPNDGRVEWRDANTITPNAGVVVDAENAAWLNPGNNFIQWGTNPLLHDTEVPMLNGAGGLNNEWSVYYSGQSTMANASNPMNVGIGYPLGTPLVGKLDVENVTFTGAGFTNINLTAGNFHNTGTYDVVYSPSSAAIAGFFTGVTAISDITDPNNAPTVNIGGYFTGTNTKFNYGVIAIGENSSLPTAYSYNGGIEGIGRDARITAGVIGVASNNGTGFGVTGYSSGSIGTTMGSRGFAQGTLTLLSEAIGVEGAASGALPGNNIGVQGSVTNTGDFAGYFQGDIATTAGFFAASDSIFKMGVLDFTPDSALLILRSLKPKTYYFDTTAYPLFTFPSKLQYGLIAEDVQTVIPNIVKNTIQPRTLDSMGNYIDSTRLNYSSLNYIELIPILTAGLKGIDSTLTARPKEACNATWVDTIENKYQWGTNPLCHTTVVPMIDDSLNEWNIYFKGQSQMQSGNPADVGIGISEDSLLLGKLDVLNVSSIGASELLSYDYTNLYAGRFNNTGYGIGTPEHWGNITDILGEHFAAVYGKSNVREGEEELALMNIGGDFTANNSTVNVGVRNIIGYEKTPGAISNIGTLSIVGSSEVAYGTYSIAVGAKTGSIGVYGSAYNGKDYNYGVWGQTAFEHDSTTAAGIANYAVYGELGDSGATTPDFAGYFNGDLGTTAGFYQVSDSKFKKEIKPFNGESAMDLLNQLQPKTYSFDNRKFKSMALPFGQQYGLLSDEVEKVLPGLVKDAVQAPKTDQYGKILIEPIQYKALNYTALIPILVAGVKEVDSTNNAQQLQNDSLQNQVNTLQQQNTTLQTQQSTLQQQLDEMKQQLQQLSDCCLTQSPTGNGTPVDGGINMNNPQSVELSNYAIILDQNSPNPFAEQTTITFTIPKDVKDAQLIFSDDKGVVIKTIAISQRGQGSVLVYASNLSSGIYTYSLLADSKLIDTKKMVCQRR